jgi:hypothetical protein
MDTQNSLLGAALTQFRQVATEDVISVSSPETDYTQYSGDPTRFCKEVLGINLWKKQKEFVESIIHNRQTIVFSGHSVGKSLGTAALTCYWLSVHEEAAVVTLAPVWNQVQNIIWQYIRQFGRKSNLPGKILETPRWNISPVRFAVGLTSNKNSEEDVTALQGYHNARLLVILDEAAGIRRIIWRTIKNLAVGENDRTIAILNPIEQSGPAWDAWTSPAWNSINVNAMDHPNVVEKKEVIPGAVSWAWVDDMIKEHCELLDEVKLLNYDGEIVEWEGKRYAPNPIFQSRVLGIAPTESETQLIKTSWIIAARQFEYETRPEDELVIALDPSRYGGDFSVMVARKGKKILWIQRRKASSKNPSIELANWLKEASLFDPDRIFIDEVGLGAGVVDVCRGVLHMDVIGINGGRKAVQSTRFTNMRTENYWNLREALRKVELDIPQGDIRLEQDLVAVQLNKRNYDHHGRYQLEEKEMLRKRLGRSPDTGDALAMTYAYYRGGNLPAQEAAMRHQEQLRRGVDVPMRWTVGLNSRKRSRWRK